jgi:peptidoglycan/xylan/chitin deacetylase (PgdA/CDA1 family)
MDRYDSHCHLVRLKVGLHRNLFPTRAYLLQPIPGLCGQCLFAGAAMRCLTALLILALFALGCAPSRPAFVLDHGAIIRGDTGRRELALIFTGGDFADGGHHIRKVLAANQIKAGFFFTGDFYRDPAKADIIRGLAQDGHYLGPHSDKHLLYASWENRDSSLVGQKDFADDLLMNYTEMAPFGLPNYDFRIFIPPYEWYNQEQVAWAADMGMTLFNFSPGTTSNADWTVPETQGYRSAQAIWNKIFEYETKDPHGLNGFILLIHIGADPRRTDKLYLRLGALIDALREKGYSFIRVDELVQRAISKRAL